MGKAEDAVTIFSALQQMDQMGQEFSVSDLFPEKGVTLQEVPKHKLLTALAARVADYQKNGITDVVQFEGTKTAIETQLAGEITEAERVILEKLQSAIADLEQS